MKEFDFNKVPIVEIANEILLDGVKKGASDIHFDPAKDGINIRMRVDGVLYDYAKVPPEFKRNMVSRIKMIASMNIMETRLPQDGAIKSKIGDKTLDLRVSTLPCHTGEKVVLRILDYSKSLQGLETLGFSEYNLDKIKKMIDMPNGIVLVTGATGSGKSTTVYSILQKLNTSEVNIITVEDPVEMEVEGLNQVQAQHEIGLDFATVLRSILRQDPDIIMIGEIRDGETASIAVRSSITGHKVVSTIHTNSALNTIERLTDMGIERYLIGTSLNGIISQKLPRKLCPYCRKPRPTSDYEKKLFDKVLHADIEKIYDVNTDGCEHCFRGYKNRIAIAEVLVITDEVRTAITNAESKEVMRKLVYVNSHTHTLLEDGLEKVAIGETNFEEILKIVDMENDLAIHNAFYDEVEADIKAGKEKRFDVDEAIRASEEARKESERIAAELKAKQESKKDEEAKKNNALADKEEKPKEEKKEDEVKPPEVIPPVVNSIIPPAVKDETNTEAAKEEEKKDEVIPPKVNDETAPKEEAKEEAKEEVKEEVTPPAVNAEVAPVEEIKEEVAPPAVNAEVAPVEEIKEEVAPPAVNAEVAPVEEIKEEVAPPAVNAEVAPVEEIKEEVAPVVNAEVAPTQVVDNTNNIPVMDSVNNQQQVQVINELPIENVQFVDNPQVIDQSIPVMVSNEVIPQNQNAFETLDFAEIPQTTAEIPLDTTYQIVGDINGPTQEIQIDPIDTYIMPQEVIPVMPGMDINYQALVPEQQVQNNNVITQVVEAE